MKNKNSIWAIIAVFFTALTFFACQSEPASKSKKLPNIILIMADDLGYETITANGGSSYHTPRIDALADQGMRFEHCYSQPLCTPSRVQIMTGIYNVRNYVRFGLLDPGQFTFGHLLQRAGYQTCIIGKWQLGKQVEAPEKAGFDRHCLWQVTEGATDDLGRDTRYSRPELQIDGKIKTFKLSDYGPDVVSQFGMDFIESSHQANQPFFLYYPMILTHCPFSPTPDSKTWHTDSTTVMKYKGKAHYFGDMMSYTDQIIGRIQDKVSELGIEKNTLIIFTGDNGTDRPIVSTLDGEAIAGAKNQSTDAGTRVPLIASWPGVIEPGSVNDNLIDFSDFFPTLAEMANIQTDSLDLDGVSFYNQLKGKKAESREWIYNWYSRSGEAEKARIFARTKDYKLYTSGEFYHIPSDRLEEKPIAFDNLEADDQKVFTALQAVLDQYQSKRLEKVKTYE